MASFGVRGKVSSDYVREIALGATRSYLRGMGIDPLTVDADGAERALDDFLRMPAMKGTYARAFADEASEYQMRLFKVEWEVWRRVHASDSPLLTTLNLEKF